MGVVEELASKTPRENSGRRAFNRFNYQQDWALCNLLEEHAAGGDYVVVFDYHDDIVVANLEPGSERLRFYQIKTSKKGQWTRKKLISRKKGKKGRLPSILGKLHGNRLIFPKACESLHFVSNATFKLPLADGKDSSSKVTIRLDELSDAERAAIRKALREEHSLAADPDGEGTTYLQVTWLSVDDHADHALGKLTAFLAARPAYAAIDARTLYRTLSDEMKRRSAYEAQPSTEAELRRMLALARAEFQKMLDDIAPPPPSLAHIEAIRSRLTAEQLPFLEVERIVRACVRYHTERAGGGNSTLQAAGDEVAQVVAALATSDEMPASLIKAMELTLARCPAAALSLTSLHSVHYAKAVTLTHLCHV